MFSVGFCSVWPILPHFLFLISCSMGTCLVFSQRFGWPSDIVEASVDEGLQLVGICLCGAPCLRAVKQNRLHVGVEDPDLVVMGLA
jgi:hypothetical protein